MPSIIPPKTIAQTISQIVPSIPAIPLAENKSLKALLSEGTVVSTVIAFIIPLYPDSKVNSFALVIPATIPG